MAPLLPIPYSYYEKSWLWDPQKVGNWLWDPLVIIVTHNRSHDFPFLKYDVAQPRSPFYSKMLFYTVSFLRATHHSSSAFTRPPPTQFGAIPGSCPRIPTLPNPPHPLHIRLRDVFPALPGQIWCTARAAPLTSHKPSVSPTASPPPPPLVHTLHIWPSPGYPPIFTIPRATYRISGHISAGGI